MLSVVLIKELREDKFGLIQIAKRQRGENLNEERKNTNFGIFHRELERTVRDRCWQDNSTSHRLAVEVQLSFPVNCLRRSSRFQVLLWTMAK
ncbi:hypothetical protein TNIN_190101 [Trichonephila inaurata madagascariensis]|uniref:Uncharacterized protein n=1 Tax=Trichonephila inaurata madagascariensis TaxID=2747483 RepID=A0A8X6IDE0_9ARAC|nr:hypothetical protein TNIN_190101 [Trichonephila inaurata madagascariensis]